MRLFLIPVLLLAMLFAAAAAGERGEVNIKLVLVDSCTIQVQDRANASPIHVECPSGEPYLMEYTDERVEDGRVEVEEGAPGEPRRLAIAF